LTTILSGIHPDSAAQARAVQQVVSLSRPRVGPFILRFQTNGTPGRASRVASPPSRSE